jgi:hypothetical protein
MGETLDALHRLQEVELRLAEVRRRIERKRRAVKKQERRVAEVEAMIRSKEASLRTDQMEADRLDLDMKSWEVEITKLRLALNTTKTNKEYSAILTQLNTNKANNSKIEERVLALFGQLEAKRETIAAIGEERNREIAKLDQLRAATREAEEASKDRAAQLTEKRDQAAANVPGEALGVFNRVAAQNDGEAMAPLFRTNPKREEYACEGCNMWVTLEQVNAVLSRDEVVLCNTCGRILCLDSSTSARTR